MSTRDACQCLRSLRHRLRESSLLSNSVRRNGAHAIHNHTRRTLTTQTTSDAPADTSSIDDGSSVQVPESLGKPEGYYRTTAAVVLLRSPVITRELSGFETAFYAYQQNLESRLASPFPTDFYFTKGSPAAKRWEAGEEARQRALDLTPATSNTDLETPIQGDELCGEERELQASEDVASNVAVSRVTDADRKNDTKSLNRKLDRTLYLLMKKSRSTHAWQFPQGPVDASEELHQTASRVLSSLAGKNMNTWNVGRLPICHSTYDYQSPQSGFNGNKVYFMKNRILAGQCVVQEGTGIEDFGWFTREELEERVAPEYWNNIKMSLGSR